MGATHVIDTSNFKDIATDLPAAIRKIAPKGANAVLDTTGVVPLIAAAVPALHSKGQIILIGIVNGKTMDVDLGALLNVRFREQKLDTHADLAVWYRYSGMHRGQREAVESEHI